VRYQQKRVFAESGGLHETTELAKMVVAAISAPLGKMYDAAHAGKLLKVVTDCLADCTKAAKKDRTRSVHDAEEDTARMLGPTAVAEIAQACHSLEEGVFEYMQALLKADENDDILQTLLSWAVECYALVTVDGAVDEAGGGVDDQRNRDMYDINTLELYDALPLEVQRLILAEVKTHMDFKKERRAAKHVMLHREGSSLASPEGVSREEHATQMVFSAPPPMVHTVQNLLPPFRRLCAVRLRCQHS
jgi:hypothetical protein